MSRSSVDEQCRRTTSRHDQSLTKLHLCLRALLHKGGLEFWSYLYRVMTQDSIPEMKLFLMMFGRCISEIRKTSRKQDT